MHEMISTMRKRRPAIRRPTSIMLHLRRPPQLVADLIAVDLITISGEGRMREPES